LASAAASSGHGGRPVCGSQKRQSEGTCRQPAGFGTSHPGVGLCKFHGGSTPSQTRNALARSTEADARAILERLGEPEPLGDPVEELLRVGAEARAWQKIIRERLSELREFSKDDVALIDRERAIVRLYTDSADRSHRVLVDLAKLGLDERMTRVREIQALRLVDAVGKVLSHPDLGLTPELQRQGRAILAAELLGHGSDSPTSLTKSQVIDAESQLVSPTSAENGVLEGAR
jgi:hypothetical protein